MQIQLGSWMRPVGHSLKPRPTLLLHPSALSSNSCVPSSRPSQPSSEVASPSLWGWSRPEGQALSTWAGACSFGPGLGQSRQQLMRVPGGGRPRPSGRASVRPGSPPVEASSSRLLWSVLGGVSAPAGPPLQGAPAHSPSWPPRPLMCAQSRQWVGVC